MHRISLLIALLICCFYAGANAQQKNFSITPEPNWLVPYKPDLKQVPDARDVSNGYYILLFEEQQHVEQSAVYHHMIRQIVSEAGIQNGAEVTVDYDPVYEKLHFHKILIRRNGKVINQLQASKFKILQQEDDLSRFIYSGVYTAYFILEDVRKGDQIEFAYTIEGDNPIFEHKFTSLFYLAFSNPVVNFHKSIIASPNREIRFKTFNNAPMPDRQMVNGMQVYKWEMTNIPSVEMEDDIPAWFDNFPSVQATEYKSWQEVIQWGDRVNKVPPPGAALMAKIAEFKREAGNSREKYMLKAVRFVQDDIRYMGIEMGEYSHRPNTPDKILLQRFGDCKDKSLLLATILKANGIYASMAYVDTYTKGHVVNYLPAPDLFNHAIVYAKLDDKEYWIDPTISYQRGNLSMLTVPDYQQGLVIDPTGKNGFSPVTNTGKGKTIIHEHFQLPSDKKNKGSLTVTSTFTMQYADDQRDGLANSSRKDNENTFLNYYKNAYGAVTIDSPLQVTDIPDSNRIVIRESYILQSPWKSDSTKEHANNFNMKANLLRDALPDYAEEDRKVAPLELRYPFSLDYTITIEMPSTWTVDEEELHIRNEYYSVHFVPSVDGNLVTMHYTFETYQDHIPASFLNTYIKDRKKIDGFLAYNFYWDLDEGTRKDSPSKGFNWLVICLGIFFAAVFTHHALRFNKVTILPAGTYAYPPQIGGWLVLMGIGVFTSPLNIFNGLLKASIFNNSMWQQLDKATNATHNLSILQLLLVTELASQIAMLVLSLLLVSLFYKKRDTFPRAMIFFLACNLTINVLDNLACNYIFEKKGWDRENIMQIVQSFVAAAIWIPYLMMSERVKETFIMPHDKEITH
ncbi:DUF3857 domain-containing protein [Chitinophaga ginsengisoli]|uniref:Uncharacterized protein DUF3857 n=1 Tax=Chitinophaga ginsengisoli TaxID=363837 RepID=A0A2P8GNS3_9BACT|nr:DUF3857 domain-containing protein [Chitinophaga ginsengisoli]PSL35618.1 uncharacterized protein DUF3857 [Chitinophaga ginsengisoli]